jgi:GNAT superfamily N-acetyltransferase
MTDLQFISLRGPEIHHYLHEIGRLRMRVFREFPYLYEGTEEEEANYLTTYTKTASSLIVLAMCGSVAIGATSCVRMSEGDSAFGACFEQAGYETSPICYFGESVLLPDYRGLGIGKAFFQHRESHARSLDCQMAAFCAVDRPLDHPLRPKEYRPLDGFWNSLGYTKHPELQATYVWKEIHESRESPKTLTFWLKPLL